MFGSIVGIVESGGYVAILLLMLAENVFPPIPSELIMPLAGFVAAQGELDPFLVVAAGVLGSILGALPWYWLGHWLGRERGCRLAGRHGRWLTIDEEGMGKALDWFNRRGGWAVLVGRVIPAIRTPISVPAGVARMPMVPFLIYSGVGTVAWTATLTASGYLLRAQYTLVADYLDIVSKIVIGLIAVSYVWRLLAGGSLGRKIGGWANGSRDDLHAVYLAARNPRVPWYAKGAAGLVALYAASPIDLIPDFLPVLGHFDDGVLIPLGILLFERLVPRDVMDEHREAARAAGERPIDWRVGAVLLVLWALATAFLLRWLLKLA